MDDDDEDDGGSAEDIDIEDEDTSAEQLLNMYRDIEGHYERCTYILC